MRLQIGQKLLYCPNSVPWVSLGRAGLGTAGRMGLDRQIFLMFNNATKTVPTKHFYRTVFKAWVQLQVYRKDHKGLEELLFYNS